MMYYLFAWFLHLFNVHTERPYGKNFNDEWNEGVGIDEYRCIVCKKIFKWED